MFCGGGDMLYDEGRREEGCHYLLYLGLRVEEVIWI